MLAATSDLLRRGLPMWSVGTGVGSCGWDQPEEIGLDGWADVLQRFVRIGVRGPISESRLRAMGIQRAEVVGDLALALALPRPWVPARVRVLGVNFVSRGTAARTEGNMRRLVRWAVDDGWEVRGFGMDPEDVAPTTALLQSAGMAGNVPLLRTFEQYCGYVGGCHMVSSVRLHGAILACCAGVPPLLVGYRDKCRDFMESMQIGEWLLAWDGAPDQWMHTARDLADRCLGERQGLVERANHWRAVLERFVSETAKQV
jgi:polysaccharide pyruvyl transferase WcaK-like protein